eukprot:4265106-Amphidinium_carterae.1
MLLRCDLGALLSGRCSSPLMMDKKEASLLMGGPVELGHAEHQMQYKACEIPHPPEPPKIKDTRK